MKDDFPRDIRISVWDKQGVNICRPTEKFSLQLANTITNKCDKPQRHIVRIHYPLMTWVASHRGPCRAPSGRPHYYQIGIDCDDENSKEVLTKTKAQDYPKIANKFSGGNSELTKLPPKREGLKTFSNISTSDDDRAGAVAGAGVLPPPVKYWNRSQFTFIPPLT
ncbi:hypothetical protein J6590_012478 [Homalodisca vitripennis]|nr:hypothetical protein J6590_012478 [Homalodisca vitripennis]